MEGMVAQAQGHAHGAGQVRLGPGGVGGEVGLDAVGFQVGLANDAQSQFVAQLMPARMVGVVRGAHGV